MADFAASIPSSQMTMGQLDSARAATGNLGAIPGAVPKGLIAGAAAGSRGPMGIAPAPRSMPAPGARMPVQQPAVAMPGRQANPAIGLMPAQSQGLPMVPGRTMPMAAQQGQMQPGAMPVFQAPPQAGVPLPAVAASNMPIRPQAMPAVNGAPAPMVQRPQTLGQIDAARAQQAGLVRSV